ncbi:hypothetical protein [Streptomyces sp. NPDC056987]|uniref:hypothetical protein n=1 Tax=Streptomyces sp. NPDC056987 TaxID=3345988 RepID=UPI00362FA77B
MLTPKDYWVQAPDGILGIDVLLLDYDGIFAPVDDVDVNGSIVWDSHHDKTGQQTRTVRGTNGEAEVTFTVESLSY